MTKPAAVSAAPERASARRAQAAGLLLGTRVLTLDGELPVEFLSPGDRVVTRSGARVLRRISVRRLAKVELVRVTARSLGHDRPDMDLLLGPAQSVRVSDWRARALFSAAQAIVPVDRLVDGSLIWRETLVEARMFTLEFDGPETVYAEGVEIGCPAVETAKAA
jgi:hypothetical protein